MNNMIKLTKKAKAKNYDEASQKAIKAAVSCIDGELQDVDPETCTAKLDDKAVSFSVNVGDDGDFLSVTVNYSDEPETYDITPMMEAQIKLAMDDTPAVHTVDPAKRHQDFIDELFSGDDDDPDEEHDFNEDPYDAEEFVDCMSMILYRCQATVREYIKNNPKAFKICVSAASNVESVYIKDDIVMAHMTNGTNKPFDELTIGQFVSITDELLYRTTLR